MEAYRRNLLVITIFLLPVLLLYAVFEVVPIVQTLYFSLFDWDGIYGTPLRYVGLRNFTSLLGDPAFVRSMKNISLFTIISLVTQLPIGLLLAILLSSYLKGYRFFKMAFFSPIVLSVTAVSLMWYFILMPNQGVLDTLLNAIGAGKLTHNWLIDRGTALNSLILVSCWVAVGYYMTITFAAISGLPEAVMDAAQIDGAVGLRKIVYVTLPMIHESLKVCVILIVTGTLKIFEIVLIMTDGGPNGLTEVPVTLLYHSAFRYYDYGSGNAIAIVVFLLSIAATVLTLKLMATDKLEY